MALFAVAGGWFAVQATEVRLDPVSAEPVRPAAGCFMSTHAGWGGRLRCGHHAVLMALMVWMLAAMAPRSDGMAGMAMRSPTITGGRLIAGVYCAAVAALLTVAGFAAAHRAVPARPATSRDDLVHALMAAGMAAMLLAMA
jgi:hypothetical protein